MKTFSALTACVTSLFLTACAPPGYELVAKASVAQFEPLNGAERLLSPAQHNFRQASADGGDPVRRGAISERFELRDGDCGGSDCGNPRARAEIEIAEGLGRDAIGQGIWYGWSFYNESVPAFTADNSLRLVFGQWTKGGANKPILRFIQLGEGEGNFDDCDPTICDTTHTAKGDLVVQLKDIAAQQNWGKAQNDGHVCRILDTQEVRGKWVDMTMHTNFSAGNDGFLRIWVDGELACDYTGPLVSAATKKDPSEIKHRRGIYASWTKRWTSTQDGAPHPNLVVYYDEFRSGPRKNDVDVPFRQSKLVPAVD